MKTVVLDASALLALLCRERGYETIQRIIDSPIACYVTAANAVESVVIARRKRCTTHDVEKVLGILGDLGIEIIPNGLEDVAEAAFLIEFVSTPQQPSTTGKNLSLGDALCLAAAHRLGAVVVADDAGWDHLPHGYEITPFR